MLSNRIFTRQKTSADIIQMTCCGVKVDKLNAEKEIEGDSYKNKKGELFCFLNKL